MVFWIRGSLAAIIPAGVLENAAKGKAVIA
jgi:hypothetical protein